jgi:hypothetical protein
MKAFLKTGIFLVFVSLFTLNVSAQETHNHKRMGAEERLAKQTEWMTQTLDLDSAKQVKVKELNLKYAKQLRDLRKADKGNDEVKVDKEEIRAQMKALEEAKEAELKEILTPEQWEKYKAHKSNKPRLVK